MNHLPGIYPHIVTITPAIKSQGQDYIGLGYTQHDEQFVLKPGGMIGAAEFIGAALCQVVGIPFCQPTIVTIERLGAKQAVFGSRMELGIVKFNQTDIASWQTIACNCSNLSAFSALLAIDLALGNDDRHWNNWMVQAGKTAAGTDTFRLRALDFSRAWPVDHPPQHPLRHRSQNTWQSPRDWDLLGVPFVQSVFYDACMLIGALPTNWLRGVLSQLADIYLKNEDVDLLCQWWDSHWREQVIDTIDALENGARP